MARRAGRGLRRRAEFPAPDQARRVLEAVGGEQRAHAAIAAAAGGRQGALPSGSLSPQLRRLTADKHVLAVDEPLSCQPGRPALYRVADSNLRMYLAMLRAAHDLARRGQAKAAFEIVDRRWAAWRGRAAEPLVRQSLELAAASGAIPWTGATAVGGWWNRRFDPEVDLVGADRAPVARRIFFAGSVKWLNTPFDSHDLAELAAAAAQVPGFDPGRAGLVIASGSGTSPGLDLRRADVVWGPDDVVGAWRDAASA